MILAVLFGGVLLIPSDISPMVASIYTLLPGAVTMMMYGVVFSSVSEAGISRTMTGTVIGISSIIGYLPDSIYSSGWIIKVQQGIQISLFSWLHPES